jgi:hypothetical protein
VEPFDHTPAKDDDALFTIFWQRERTANLLCFSQILGRGRERLVGGLNLRGMYQRLAVKSHAGALRTFGFETVIVAEIIPDAV